MTERRFTTEEIRLIAECERQMDRGEVPFVIWHGERCPVEPIIMTELGLEQGQTINDHIYYAISLATLNYCRAQVALQKMSEKKDP